VTDEDFSWNPDEFDLDEENLLERDSENLVTISASLISPRPATFNLRTGAIMLGRKKDFSDDPENGWMNRMRNIFLPIRGEDR